VLQFVSVCFLCVSLFFSVSNCVALPCCSASAGPLDVKRHKSCLAFKCDIVVCCSVLQCVAVCCNAKRHESCLAFKCDIASVLQCVAMC